MTLQDTIGGVICILAVWWIFQAMRAGALDAVFDPTDDDLDILP